MTNLRMPKLAIDKVAGKIERTLSSFLSKSAAEKYVVGLSGGVDSSTAVALAVRAAGRQKVTGLMLPDRRVTPARDIRDSEQLVKMLGIQAYRIDLAEIVDRFAQASPFFDSEARVANGNLRARIRMTLIYYYANLEKALVLGTGDRSEILIGYFTKYGDGATDLLPLGDLYKTQVRQLARFLKIPSSIVSKPSSPRLWEGHSAHDELGLDYETIDLILYGYFDLELPRGRIARELGIPASVVKGLLDRNRASEHKRNPPPVVMLRGQQPKPSQWQI